MIPPEFPDEPVRRGRGKNKNTLYLRVGNEKGVRIQCKGCKETLPVKSAKGLNEEINRIKHLPDVLKNHSSCPDTDCENHGVDITHGKGFYYKHGKNKSGNPRYKCKSCNKTFVVNTNPLQRQRITSQNKAIFLQLVNKVPTQRIVEMTGINPSALYGKIDFIYRQCLLFSRHKEKKLQNLLADKKLNLATDTQYHLVNWTKRKDKRNTQLLAIATCCNDTSYVFGNHLNFDSSIQQTEIEDIVDSENETNDDAAFRETARFWTYADYAKARRRSHKSKSLRSRTTESVIEATYEDALNRENIDNSFNMDDFLKLPDKGVQIHSEYTLLAHFKYINEITAKAKRVLHCMDQDSGMRAGFMLGYRDRLAIKGQNQIDGFYVQFNKELTVDEKRRIYAENKSYLKKYAAEEQIDERAAVYFITSDNIQNAREIGKWSDRWVEIPTASMGEPEKMVCHLNDQGQHSERRLTWLHIKATLHSVDRYFMQVRRMIHYLERPVNSASNAGGLWNGYNAYNPEMVEKLLTIFRVYYNFCKKGDDGQTPAQRIGLSKGINNVEDILYFHPNANLMRNA